MPSRGEKASCCKSSHTGKMELPILYQIGNTRQKVPAIEGGRGTSHSVFRLQTVVDFITTSLGPGDSGGGNHHPFQLFTQSPPERRRFCGRWGHGGKWEKGDRGAITARKVAERQPSQKRGGRGGKAPPHPNDRERGRRGIQRQNRKKMEQECLFQPEIMWEHWPSRHYELVLPLMVKCLPSPPVFSLGSRSLAPFLAEV